MTHNKWLPRTRSILAALRLAPFWPVFSSILVSLYSDLIYSTLISESELLYDWRFTVNQFVLATRFLRLTTSNFIFQLNTCCFIPYVTSPLSREWVCCLQLLLVLASAVILITTSYCLRFHALPTWRAGSLYLYQPGTEWPGYTPWHWVHFSLPPTTHRVMVEVLGPASPQDCSELTYDSCYKTSRRTDKNTFHFVSKKTSVYHMYPRKRRLDFQ
jgi:hypothetical protein